MNVIKTKGASLVAQVVKNLPAVRETWVRSLGWEDPLEKGRTTHSSILAWRIPWTVESMGLQTKSRTQLSNFHLWADPWGSCISNSCHFWTSLIPQLVKNPPAITLVRFLYWEDPLEKGQATHSSILGFPCGSTGKESACNAGDWVQSLGWEDPGIQTANIHWIIEKAREFQKNTYFCFIGYAKAFDCVDHNKLWKILKEIGILDHLICPLRNLYESQKANYNWTWNNRLVSNRERSTSRLYIVTLLI